MKKFSLTIVAIINFVILFVGVSYTASKGITVTPMYTFYSEGVTLSGIRDFIMYYLSPTILLVTCFFYGKKSIPIKIALFSNVVANVAIIISYSFLLAKITELYSLVPNVVLCSLLIIVDIFLLSDKIYLKKWIVILSAFGIIFLLGMKISYGFYAINSWELSVLLTFITRMILSRNELSQKLPQQE